MLAVKDKAFVVLLNNWDKSNAATSSKQGIVCCLMGVTLVLETMIFTFTSPFTKQAYSNTVA